MRVEFLKFDEGEILLETKLNITVTEFIYAIVVGAAFQNISLPLFSDGNAILLFSFVIIVDDWVMYHAASSTVPDSPSNFTVTLAIDIIILVIWYCAALTATGGINAFPEWFWLLSAYCASTAAWEFKFRKSISNPARLVGDSICCVIFMGIALLINFNLIPISLWILPIVILIWLPIRYVLWKKTILALPVQMMKVENA